MRIGIIGLGYVGLTLAISAADHGVDVYGVEISGHIKECLAENRAHFFEPGLDALIEKHNGKMFHCVDEFPEALSYDAFIITVGTPLKQGEKTPNFSAIKSALESIRKVYTGKELVILRSTVSVGTTRNVVMPFLASLCGKPEDQILAGMCPERTVEGKAVEELTQLPQIISGSSEEALEIAQKFFRHMTPYVIPVGSLEEAELVKLYCNTYRDMTFAIGNAFCLAAQTFGVDGTSVIRHANQGYARANIPLPGFVAGPCLEKDAYILTNNMPACGSRDFIMGARRLNEALEDVVVEWVRLRIGAASPEKTVVLSGMAFKGQPVTSDLRGSSSVYIAQKLRAEGYRLRLHDYAALPEELEALELGEVYESLEQACRGAALLLVLNNHKKYETLRSFPALTEGEGPAAVLDAWGMCRDLTRDPQVSVCTLGNLMIQ